MASRGIDINTIKAFFDGVALYFNPSRHSEIFSYTDKPEFSRITQINSMLPVFDVVKPVEHDNLKIDKIFNNCGIYSQEQVHEFMNLLSEAINSQLPMLKKHNVHAITFELSSINHTILLGYYLKTLIWNILDANHIDSEIQNKDFLFSDSSSMNLLTQHIFQAFDKINSQSNKERIGFSTTAFLASDKATMPELEQISKSLNNYLSSHGYWQALFDPASIINKNLTKPELEYWLNIAARYGFLDLCRNILANNHQSININAKTEGFTPLMEAVAYATGDNYLEIVKLLLKYEANANIYDDKLIYPLHYAAEFGLYDIAKELLQHGADINYTNIYEDTPFMRAVFVNNMSIVNLFLEHKYKPDVNVVNNYDGSTALHYAINNKNIEMVEKLIKAGANVNIKNKKGLSPLHMAVNAGSKEIVKLLINHGANPNVIVFGKKPIDAALQQKNEGMVKAMLKKPKTN